MLLGELLYNDDEWFNLKLDLHLETTKGNKILYANFKDGKHFFTFSDSVSKDYPLKETFVSIKIFDEEREFVKQLKDQGFLTGSMDLVKNTEGILIASYEFKALIEHTDVNLDNRFTLRLYNTETYMNEFIDKKENKVLSVNVPFKGFGNEFVLPLENELLLEKEKVILPFCRSGKKFAYDKGTYHPIMECFTLSKNISYYSVTGGVAQH